MTGRVALVTGAARGIGAATVRRLAADGWAVVALDRCADDPALAYPLARPQELHALPDSCPDPTLVTTLTGDARDRAVVERAVALAADRFGGLDAVVGGVGAIAGAPLWEMTDAQVDAMLDINLGSAVTLARVTVPALLQRPAPRSGRFVAVASAAATRGMPRLAAYGAAKAGVTGLVRGLAADLAGSGITVNAVAPGSTATAMLEESARIYGLPGPESFAPQQLLGRLLAPEEVAAAIAWLCGPDAGGVTGAVVPVDAGLVV